MIRDYEHGMDSEQSDVEIALMMMQISDYHLYRWREAFPTTFGIVAESEMARRSKLGSRSWEDVVVYKLGELLEGES